MDYALKQHGRASIDFLMDAMGVNAKNLFASIDDKAPKSLARSLPETPADRGDVFEDHMRSSPQFRLFGMVRRWQLNEHGRIAKSAFDEIEADVADQLRGYEQGPSTLHLDDAFSPPEYWRDVPWHGTDGGWDGHRYMGFVHGELVFRTMICGSMPGDPIAQRRSTLDALDGFQPEKILEIGAGSGQYTEVLAQMYPEADLTSCDLSQRQLEHAHRRANAQGLKIAFRQAPGEATGLPDGTFDLVTSYALFHELPEATAKAQMAEAFRVLKPGGWLLIADVKAYAAMDVFDAWQSDFWNQVYGDDPYWRAHGERDMAGLAQAAGFSGATYEGLGANRYPYVLTTQKPAS